MLFLRDRARSGDRLLHRRQRRAGRLLCGGAEAVLFHAFAAPSEYRSIHRGGEARRGAGCAGDQHGWSKPGREGTVRRGNVAALQRARGTGSAPFHPSLSGGNRRCQGEGSVHEPPRSEEHTSELQSLMRISYAVFCLKKKTNKPKRIRK